MSGLPTPRERAAMAPSEARAIFRSGVRAPTSGWADGYAQANLLALPRADAFDFLLFAQRNPKPCPILGVLEPGETSGDLLPGGDVRTDAPGYVVFRDGAVVDRPARVDEYWREDLVTFLIGCSFTFEAALVAEGIPMAHQRQGVNVPMYVTNRDCARAGRLAGPLVVSMRPIAPDRVADAVRISSRYPAVHGAPVHVGAPELLGIADLDRPDFGDPVRVAPGEVPVFWACGVTPQAAVMASRPPLAIAHEPGHMLVTDAEDARYLVP